MDKKTILRERFGFPFFRDGQEALIDAILAGRDVFGVMPTGGGKSLCYQIPALLLEGLTLVVSPLISLMKDQVAALKEAGIPAAFLNSSLTAAQQREVLRRGEIGAYKLIYVAPERLLTDSFLEFAARQQVSLLAVDEAHCVAQWGESFRPAYAEIGGFLQKLPVRPVVLAMTATADGRIRAQIAASLGMRHPKTVTLPIVRPNLRYALCTTLNTTAWIQDYVRAHAGAKGLVFCATRKRCEALAARLAALTGEDSAPIRAA